MKTQLDENATSTNPGCKHAVNNLRRYINRLVFVSRHWRALRPAMSYAWNEVGHNQLCYYANVYRSDKGLGGHNYTRIYNNLFHAIRHNVQYVLEIGLLRAVIRERLHTPVFSDAPSLKMWSMYFPNANIIGFDIEDFSDFVFERCTTIQGDQSCRADLSKISRFLGGAKLDIVVDDGLHASRHQQISLGTLFPLVKKGGYYIIEDLDYQPKWVKEDMSHKTVLVLNDFLRNGCVRSPYLSRAENEYLTAHIGSIMYFDSLDPNHVGRISLGVIQKTNEIIADSADVT